MPAPIRILHIADTHLGFDYAFRPRVHRRRRGPDFFENYERALEPARAGRVDLVVHGGDVLFRSKVPPLLVQMAMAPLRRVADAGVPVFIVPGNHERGRIPYPLLSEHPGIFIFNRPRCFEITVRGIRVALIGFPFIRRVARSIRTLLREARSGMGRAEIRLLCLHQSVCGAKVGPVGYTFRARRGEPDVIAGADIPSDVAAVLAGHIHRAQILRADAWGATLPAPVIYPGSIERTSFVEANETKGYGLLDVLTSGTGGALQRATFVPLPTRPMITIDLDVDRSRDLAHEVKERLAGLDPNAVVRLRLLGDTIDAALRTLTAARLRELAPTTMNLTLSPSRNRPEGISFSRGNQHTTPHAASGDDSHSLDLFSSRARRPGR